MQTTIAFPQDLWLELLAALVQPAETAAVIVARLARGEDQLTLLVRRVLWVPEEHYLRRELGGLEISSQGYVPALKVAADDGAVAIFFHTHPGGDPHPSRLDALVDDELATAFQVRTEQALYASLILGGNPAAPRFSGRLFEQGGELSLERVRVVGSRIRLLQSAQAGSVDSAAFDRQIRAFGVEGQRVLQSLRVGVVGAGGTGSAVFELLVRLGAGEIVVVDDDVVTASNLTRIHESAQADLGRPKVEVAATASERIGLGTRVTSLVGRITEEALARSLRHCDVVFGCTDENRGRAILSRLAYYYLVCVVDTAFMVDAHEGVVRGLFGRVTAVTPGTACLVCRGRIDPARLAAEALPEEERVRLAEEGYVPGLDEPDPAVGAYTTMTATFALNELLERLFGYGPEQPPSELLIRLHDRELSSTTAEPRADHYCADRAVWGRGDTDPFLEQLWA